MSPERRQRLLDLLEECATAGSPIYQSMSGEGIVAKLKADQFLVFDKSELLAKLDEVFDGGYAFGLAIAELDR